MPQQDLDDADIDTLLEQVSGKRVAQCMRAYPLVDLGALGRFLHDAVQLDEFALIHHIDLLLSRPIIPEERSLHAPSQLLADTLIRRGFDGVSYGSSVGTGTNLCVFRPELFSFDETQSSVRQVDALTYRFSEVPETVRADWNP